MKKRTIKKTNRGEEKKTNFTELDNRGEEKKTNFTELDKGKKNEKLETVS